MANKIAQHLNDLISVSVILLMATALISGISGADAQGLASNSDKQLELAPSLLDTTVLMDSSSTTFELHFDVTFDDVAASISITDLGNATGELRNNQPRLGK